MAIFGMLNDVEQQLGHRQKLKPAFEYLKQAITAGSEINQRILGLNQDQFERIELENGLFAIEQSYLTRTIEDSFFESHIQHLDMQFVVAGHEQMEVAQITELKQTADYDTEHDYSKYATAVESSNIQMKAGCLGILFPNDGHMPGIKTSLGKQRVFKTVVKVPVSLL